MPDRATSRPSVGVHTSSPGTAGGTSTGGVPSPDGEGSGDVCAAAGTGTASETRPSTTSAACTTRGATGAAVSRPPTATVSHVGPPRTRPDPATMPGPADSRLLRSGGPVLAAVPVGCERRRQLRVHPGGDPGAGRLVTDLDHLTPLVQ